MEFSREEFAVLLNANARKVSNKIRKSVSDFVPKANLFCTRTQEEAVRAIEDIVQRRVPTLFCGGGDGTLVNVLSNLKKALDNLNEKYHTTFEPPRIAPLRLGTGNAVAGYMGIQKGLAPLMNYLSTAKESLTRFNLIEKDDKVFHFAGLGWDAAVLNDYMLLKSKFGNALARWWMHGITGYVTSMILKTIPEQMFQRNRPHLKVIAEGPVYRVGANLKAPELVTPEGGVLYEGPCNVAGVSTVPEYGYRMKAFPFARSMDGYMNLRIIKAGLFEVVTHWASIYSGRWKSANLMDYMAKKIELVWDRPMPLHVGGDAEGMLDRVTFSISDFAVDVLNPHAETGL